MRETKFICNENLLKLKVLKMLFEFQVERNQAILAREYQMLIKQILCGGMFATY